MITEELIQRSPEWYAVRCGKVTASRIGDLMATTAKGWSARRMRYMEEIVAERMTGKPVIKQVASMNARIEMEPDARAAYEFYSDNTVDLVGFIAHPTIKMAGCSPDGLVGDEGGLEIKCPDSSTHIEMLKTRIVDPDYILQCQFAMACSGRLWWDFVSFDPRMQEEEFKLFRRCLNRDSGLIGRVEGAVRDFLAEVDAEVAKLREYRI